MVVLFIHKHKRGIPYKITNPEYVKKLESQASLGDCNQLPLIVFLYSFNYNDGFYFLYAVNLCTSSCK